MCGFRNLVVRALGIAGMAARFFAFLRDYDGLDWEEVDDQLLMGSDQGFSENALEPNNKYLTP